MCTVIFSSSVVDVCIYFLRQVFGLVLQVVSELGYTMGMTKNKTINDKFELVGELLYGLARLGKDDVNLVILRSDDERLAELSVSELENIMQTINVDASAFSGYQREDQDGYVVYTMMVNKLALRDYLIEAYGKEQKSIAELQKEYLDKQVLYWVSFKTGGEVILNDKYLMTSLQYGGLPYEVFNYLYHNIDKTVTKKQVEKQARMEITQDLSKIMYDMGFKGVLKKTFFKSSKGRMMMRNHLTRGQIKELGVDEASSDELISHMVQEQAFQIVD